MKKISALVLLISLFNIQAAQALVQTRPLATDARIRVVAYQSNNVVPVFATLFTATQIEFAKDEAIENIQNGDLDAWSVSVQKGLANMLFLKPTICGSNTNMTVITNRHSYYFHLTSAKTETENQNNNTYAIHFTYPEDERTEYLANVRYNDMQAQALLNAHKNPKNYNWDYSFSGSHSIMPLHIFDDGQFTYMQLQTGQPVSAIFAVDNVLGKEAVVNYRRDGQYLIIQQIAPQFTLREGKYHVASIFNNKRINQLRIRGEG